MVLEVWRRRRALGYHQASSDVSVQTHSRDAMSGPLRSMQQVLDAIVNGELFPDQTRSGYFKQGDERNNGPQPIVDDPSSSESSVDEEDHDPEKDEESIDAVAGTWQSNRDTPWTSLAAVYFRRKISRCVHILMDEAGAEFSCGRRISPSYVRLQKRPEFLQLDASERYPGQAECSYVQT